MAIGVEMMGLPVMRKVGLLSSVSTAQETPFSFTPSKQANGAARHAKRDFVCSASTTPRLSRAQKPMDS